MILSLLCIHEVPCATLPHPRGVGCLVLEGLAPIDVCGLVCAVSFGLSLIFYIPVLRATQPRYQSPETLYGIRGVLRCGGGRLCLCVHNTPRIHVSKIATEGENPVGVKKLCTQQ